MTAAKVLPLSRLLERLKSDRRGGKKIVFTNGCFDLLHLGHVRYLRQARSLGDRLVVGVNRDASVRGNKGSGRPVCSERERSEVLAALESVDYVTLFSEKTPERLIRAVRPDVLVKGGDWKKKDIVGWQFVESYGGKVRPLKFVDGFSTTRLIEKVKKAY
ncbi:MAG TPA: D-glycero-beta-D-manno-heptose 1-phosphate adenylyltransferase [Candidatus Eisenbacteria bacterium]|jgi:D-beta-D-heptose 7-phosphate kinase/D-beta-D-heptose 1-phosphate adenosyltransferase|nr:D-glycero-beta-D-manno-heptose 1-phosphate adenylyltransferase [Candidatus Eisenbacteria bacterium]